MLPKPPSFPQPVPLTIYLQSQVHLDERKILLHLNGEEEREVVARATTNHMIGTWNIFAELNRMGSLELSSSGMARWSPSKGRGPSSSPTSLGNIVSLMGSTTSYGSPPTLSVLASLMRMDSRLTLSLGYYTSTTNDTNASPRFGDHRAISTTLT